MNLHGTLLSATHQEDISHSSLKELALSSGSQKWPDKIIHEISVYKIIYQTTYINAPVSASGLLYVPKSVSLVFPVVSLQHGTIFLKSDAPSQCSGFAGGELLCSAGYIVLQPDYLGYGISEDIFHPYYDKTHAAASVLDMIEAALTYLSEINIRHSGKLFLTGYSEGGYVTLAAQSAIEKNNTIGLELIAVAAGAGGYDLFALLSDFTTGAGSHVQPSYIVFLLMAYEKIYGWNKPLHYYFSSKYADILPELMNGNYNSAYINHNLSSNLASLFNREFYQNLTGPGEMDLKKALFINSLSDWKPQTPLRLYHGTEDEVIPYRNSEITFHKMKEKGADDLTFMSIPQGDHDSSKAPMMDSVLAWFEKF